MVGSLLMLVAIFYLYVQAPRGHAAATPSTYEQLSTLALPHDAQLWCFAAFALAFAHQGAAVPAPHLAARRARRGADGGLGDPGRRAAQVRHLRLPALRDAAVPARRVGAGRRCSSIAGGDRHHLRRARRVRAGRRQEAVAYSSVSHLGFCVLGLVRAERAGHRGRDLRDARRTASRRAACSSASACSTSAATRAGSPSTAASGSRCRSSPACS